MLPSAGNKPGQSSRCLQLNSSQLPARPDVSVPTQRATPAPFGVCGGGSTRPGTHILEGLECHLLVRFTSYTASSSANLARRGRQLGLLHPQQRPHQAPTSGPVLPGSTVILLPKERQLPACRKETENKPQTKRMCLVCLLRFTLEIGVKETNFAVNCRHSHVKESQRGPKPQRYKKERTIIQNIQVFFWIAWKSGTVSSLFQLP